MEGDDATCRRLARGAGCAVLSVDYRLAPENRFPAALEDVHAAAVWAREHALLIHGDGGRIAVGGVSAGGNLAAATALLARDRGGPSLVFQLLVCPITDRNFDTDSYLECGNAFRPQRDTMMWFWDHYLNEDSEARNPLAAPLQAPDLAGLPAGHVVVAECDPLRDEGEAYARRLREAGIPVTCVRYPNTIHYVFHLPDRIEKGALAVAEACAALRRAFAEPSR
jgi:acetyl esterase